MAGPRHAEHRFTADAPGTQVVNLCLLAGFELSLLIMMPSGTKLSASLLLAPTLVRPQYRELDQLPRLLNETS